MSCTHTPASGPASAVESFSEWHDGAQAHAHGERYRALMPAAAPRPGEQYAFEVNLDQCTGCKACVAACHSLNGLDEGESFRDIGFLVGSATDGSAWQQTVTTACHHCADPGCLSGCPTQAYEKDPISGIVRHLDDQCFGCRYCEMKCPYGVPKWNARLGIVRKCDMCQQRLQAGEAPACVQACPNGAIAIRVVPIAPARARTEPVIFGAVDSTRTHPVTLYVSAKPKPKVAAAPDAARMRTEHAHLPLVVMLVLTQAAAGVALAGALAGSFAGASGSRALGVLAGVLGLAGLGAATFHLGKPLKAWKAVLGWRTSWLSREALAFGPFAALLHLLPVLALFGPRLQALLAERWPDAAAKLPMELPAALPWVALATGLVGLPGVFCSIMVYVDTGRRGWSLVRTGARFGGTTVVLGLAAWACGGGPWWPAMLAGLLKLAVEWRWQLRDEKVAKADPLSVAARSARELLGDLLSARYAVGIAGALAAPANPWVALALLLVAEGLERTLFFAATPAERMPGVEEAHP